jgi:V/A-type H+/Na+-transporting ATPase subunit G/H
LAKEKTVHVAEVPSPTSLSAVETIVSALSGLEDDIEKLYVTAEEMKKRLMAHSNEEVEKLKQLVIVMATEEAKKIVDSARAEAEAEAEKIGEQGRANTANLKKNINSMFAASVDSIVKTVLGDAIPAAKPQPAKAKKPSSDERPAS